MGLWVKVRVFSDFFMLTLGDVFILRVKDVHTGLYHLFADNFSCPLTYMGRTRHNYFDARKDYRL